MRSMLAFWMGGAEAPVIAQPDPLGRLFVQFRAIAPPTGTLVMLAGPTGSIEVVQ